MFLLGCFKLVSLPKAIMDCELMYICLKVLSMLKMFQCLSFPLYLAAVGCILLEIVFGLYVWVYNVLKVTIYLGGQPPQFVFLHSIHCSPFEQIF